MRLPLDTTKVGFICATEAVEVLDFETKQPKRDGHGTPLYRLGILTMVDGTADVLQVKVPGAPKGVTAGAPVRLVGMFAQPWDNGKAKGVSFGAERVEPARPDTARSAS